jgi:hypothetical protein
MHYKPKPANMKRLKILPLAVIALALGLTSCENHGKEYKFDKDHNVYYKGDGLDEAGAKKLADYLKEQEYFQAGKEATVQITKTKDTKDTVNLNFIVDKDKINGDMEKNFTIFGGMISKNVFSGSPCTVHLLDKYFKEIKNLGYAPAATEAPVPATTEQPAEPGK